LLAGIREPGEKRTIEPANHIIYMQLAAQYLCRVGKGMPAPGSFLAHLSTCNPQVFPQLPCGLRKRQSTAQGEKEANRGLFFTLCGMIGSAAISAE
jgi:hypothetical protein